MAAKKFTKTSAEAFKSFVTEAGMLLKKFDPESPNVQDQDIICATTGGIQISDVPSYIDQGEDVDNVPNNTMELMEVDRHECKIGTTCLNITPDTLALGIGVADVSGDKVTPRSHLEPEDFKDIWWVGDRNDGGMVAAHLMHALSSAGLSLKTTKKGKGQLAMELTGHYSMKSLDTVPMEFFSAGPSLSAKV